VQVEHEGTGTLDETSTTAPLTKGLAMWKLVWLFVSIGLVCIVGLLALVRREVHVAQGGEIQWDDFGFSVIEHRTEARIGELEPRGIFHVVKLEVRNHAVRVGYRLDNHRPVLVDDTGDRYEVDAAAEKVIDPGWPHRDVIPHGTTFASEFVFDVPKDKQSLRLSVSWGGALIDLLDNTVSGPRDIALR
jgi:hypothetical protein